ncbi:vitamin K epoxide reductase family protein [Patescibacteria group bacterium]|nr:vitamin K epoxide reductase family protein [Patescibacteria group bacterium]MBU1472707.1 vitamin K epoxide reductase family protein [Patescibacteria group bacterium]MBU2459974.1 vitamin K epoxide reductase family protein [Patescibacteria group bacterium]MBU2544368.1 vitamin K epoxide reductase family protein [Patescibacteria group bacterium]
MKKPLEYGMFVLSIFGILVAGYLTWEHYAHIVPPCTTRFSFVDCGAVLQSKYSAIFGIPLALFGFVFYIMELILSWLVITTGERLFKLTVLTVAAIGAVASGYLVYLQLVVIQAVCLYCMASAVISVLLFIFSQVAFAAENRYLVDVFFRIFKKT